MSCKTTEAQQREADVVAAAADCEAVQR